MKEKSEIKTIRLQMVISKSERDAIDKWRAKQPDIPSRSEAIRRLVKQSLDFNNTNDEKPRRP